MAKEVLLYGVIDAESSSQFIKDCNTAMELGTLQEVEIRINTEGGEVSYGHGTVKKIAEIPNKKIKVDGMCYSMGAIALLYCNDVEAIDTARFMFHRAGYAQWFEKSEYFTEALKNNTAAINADAEKAFRKKIDVPAFEEIAGIKVKDLFSMESNPDEDMVFLSAKEAKKIGLIDKIVPLSENVKAFVNSKMQLVSAKFNKFRVAAQDPEPQTKKLMNIQELKAQYPSIYDEVFEIGAKAGVSAERDRVSAALVFNHLDPEGVKVIIASGKPMTATQQAEFALKAMSPKAIEELAAGASKPVPTGPTDDGKKDKPNPELDNFAKSVRASLNLKDKSESDVIMGFERGVRATA